MNQKKPSEAWHWSVHLLWIIPVAAFMFLIGQRAAERRIEPQVRAAEQLRRDLERLDSVPEHQRLSEMIAALARANEASPELIDLLESSDDLESRAVARPLRAVRDNPDVRDPEFLDQLSSLLKRDAPSFMGTWAVPQN